MPRDQEVLLPTARQPESIHMITKPVNIKTNKTCKYADHCVLTLPNLNIYSAPDVFTCIRTRVFFTEAVKTLVRVVKCPARSECSCCVLGLTQTGLKFNELQ